MLLLGRSSNLSPPMVYSADDRFSRRLAYISQVEQEWWDRWVKSVLPTLLSYKKWKSKQDNFKVGDIVMLHYPKHFKDDYCLARVIKVHSDEDNLVGKDGEKLIRKVTICYRWRNPKESAEVYQTKPLITEQVAIHRLHRLDLADEACLVIADSNKIWSTEETWIYRLLPSDFFRFYFWTLCKLIVLMLAII